MKKDKGFSVFIISGLITGLILSIVLLNFNFSPVDKFLIISGGVIFLSSLTGGCYYSYLIRKFKK